MAISGLQIIGESINDSVPSTKKLFDANDLDGILNLAKSQDEREESAPARRAAADSGGEEEE